MIQVSKIGIAANLCYYDLEEMQEERRKDAEKWE